MKYPIYWDNGSYDSFLFGTDLEKDGRSVSFKNRMMPSGKYLKTWLSKTNYQRNRISPSLPLLRKGTKYSIKLFARMYPSNSVYIKISFENRFGQEVGTQILKEPEGVFIYPKEAYAYRVELFNAGCEELLFHYLLIYDEEIADDVDNNWNPSNIDSLEKSQYNSDTLYVVFMENDASLWHEVRNAFDSWRRVLLVGDSNARGSYYNSYEFANDLAKRLQGFSYENIYFIGYGPISNFAAAFYSLEYRESHAYVTNQVYDISTYQRALDKVVGVSEYRSETVLYHMKYANNITFYGQSDDPILSLFDGLCFPLFRLNDFFRKQEKRKKRL